ncbi:MAG: arginase family protein [Bacteroidales bacterium]
MLDLNDYFNPVSIERPEYHLLTGSASFSHNITIHTENNPVKDIGKFRIAILGVPDGRNSPDEGTAAAPDIIRRCLYTMTRIPGKTKIIDLGNMKKGTGFNDTIAGLSDVLTYLASENVFAVIIGGSSALVRSIDSRFSAGQKPYTMLSVDSRIDFHPERKSSDSFNFLNQIIYNPGSSIKHFINIGYQTYLNDQQTINRLVKKRADLFRIGDVRQGIHLTEPLMRDSDVAVFDISAVRQSDAPGTFAPSPNGFYGEEICLLSRYAGISDNLKIFGIFEVNPSFDNRDQTSALAAQILWFFLEGFSQKQFEVPLLDDPMSGRFIRYHVRITDLDDDLIFVKSTLTERWWLELQADDKTTEYVACSHEDYQQANRNEVPDRWVRAAARLKK